MLFRRKRRSLLGNHVMGNLGYCSTFPVCVIPDSKSTPLMGTLGSLHAAFGGTRPLPATSPDFAGLCQTLPSPNSRYSLCREPGSYRSCQWGMILRLRDETVEAILLRLLFFFLLCSLLAILGATCRKKFGMVMRQPQTIPEVISATLVLLVILVDFEGRGNARP